jgi:hypothetical protein
MIEKNEFITMLIQAIAMGTITLIIGTIIFKLSLKGKEKEIEYNYFKNKPYGINIAFFMTGFVIHVLLDITGFNKWYCDKECNTIMCKITKQIINN